MQKRRVSITSDYFTTFLKHHQNEKITQAVAKQSYYKGISTKNNQNEQGIIRYIRGFPLLFRSINPLAQFGFWGKKKNTKDRKKSPSHLLSQLELEQLYFDTKKKKTNKKPKDRKTFSFKNLLGILGQKH